MIEYIFGRNGSGKLTYILDCIKKDGRIRSNILIIPENETLNIESRVLDNNVSGYTQIMTIPLICKDVFMQHGGLNKKNIPSSSKKMIMYNILSSDESKTNLYGNISKNDARTVDTMLSLYRELIRNNITCDDLLKTSQILKDEKKYLSQKLNDLSCIFREYENRISERWNDSEKDVLRAAKIKNNLYEDCNIYVYGFNSLEKSEYLLFKNIFSQAKNVYISFNYNPEQDKDIINFSSSITYKECFDKLFKELEKEGTKTIFNPGVILTNDVKHKSADLSFLASKIYREEEFEGPVDNITIFRCDNKIEECVSVCSDICKRIYDSRNDDKDPELRFADMTITCSNLSDYEGILEPILEKYEIPYNWVDGYDIQNDALMRYIYAIFDCVSYNFRREHVIKLVKNGYSGFDEYDKDIFEKYVYKWDINGYDSYEKTWVNSILGFDTRDDEYVKNTLDIVNRIREKLSNDIYPLFKELRGKNKVIELSKALYKFLVDEGVQNRVIDRANGLYKDNYDEANRINDLWQTICKNMEDIVDTLGEDTLCTFDEYIQMFKLGIKDSTRQNPKSSLDRVVVGSINKVRPNNIRHLYILGANEGVFPSNISDSKYINDRDRQFLKKNSYLDFSNYREKKTGDELINFYNTICLPSESLTFAYNEQLTNDGKNERSSELDYITTQLKELKEVQFSQMGMERIWKKTQAFESIVYCQEDLKTAIYEYYKEDKESKIKNFSEYKFKVDDYSIDKDLSKEFFDGKMLTMSYSKLESYLRCEYNYFCDRYLNLLDDERAKFSSNLVGSLMHSILEHAVPKIIELKAKNGDVDDENLKKEMVPLIDEQIGSFLQSQMYKDKPSVELSLALEKIKESSYRVIKKTKDSITKCQFVPQFYELDISNKSKGNDYTLPFKVGYSKDDNGNDKEIVLTGKIDRVDVYDYNGKKYVRIVDYKSSDKEFNLDEAKRGLKSQMLIYLYSIKENGILNGKDGAKIIDQDEIVPAGIVYATASSKTQSDNETSSKKYNAFILDDDKIIEEFKKDACVNIKSDEKSKDKFTFKLDENQTNGFDKIKKELQNTIISAANSMVKGEAKTYKKMKEDGSSVSSPCGFCKYSNVCKNAEASFWKQ